MKEATHYFTDEEKIYIKLKSDSYSKYEVEMLLGGVWCLCPFGGKEEHWNLTKV